MKRVEILYQNSLETSVMAVLYPISVNCLEIISILKQDIPDDAQTIDNFFDDVSSLMERKNITVNKETNKYTLFDDAIDE